MKWFVSCVLLLCCFSVFAQVPIKEQCRRLIEAEKFEEAQKLLLEIQSIDPTDAEFLLLSELFSDKRAAARANEKEKDAYLNAKEKNTKDAYKNFINNYPESKYVSEANKAIETLQKAEEDTAWHNAQLSNTKEAYESYKRKYPTAHVTEVNNALQKLREIELQKKRDQEQQEEENLWQYAMNSNTISAYENYLQKTKLRTHATEAHSRIDGLRSTQAKQWQEQDWHTACSQNTLSAYQQYINRYGKNAAHAQEAEKQIQILSQKGQKENQHLRHQQQRRQRRNNFGSAVALGWQIVDLSSNLYVSSVASGLRLRFFRYNFPINISLAALYQYNFTIKGHANKDKVFPKLSSLDRQSLTIPLQLKLNCSNPNYIGGKFYFAFAIAPEFVLKQDNNAFNPKAISYMPSIGINWRHADLSFYARHYLSQYPMLHPTYRLEEPPYSLKDWFVGLGVTWYF